MSRIKPESLHFKYIIPLAGYDRHDVMLALSKAESRRNDCRSRLDFHDPLGEPRSAVVEQLKGASLEYERLLAGLKLVENADFRAALMVLKHHADRLGLSSETEQEVFLQVLDHDQALSEAWHRVDDIGLPITTELLRNAQR